MTTLTSWGKQPFDAGRMQALLSSGCFTHVLIENDEAEWHQWTPPVATSGMVDWLNNSPLASEISLYVAGLRLFETAQTDLRWVGVPGRTALEGCDS